MVLLSAGEIRADAPVASYIFPAGGQRGKAVNVRVGGLNLHKSCFFEMLGPGVDASKQLQRTRTIWFEGPRLGMPESQQQEDYPKDTAGRVQIAADAPLGVRYWRLWNSQGATPALKFMVGDLPEIIEQEIDGDPLPAEVTLPVTINGRIFPRENVDVWTFAARKGQIVSCEVNAARLGSPLDSRLEILDPQGRVLAENDDFFGADSFLRFTAPADGKYQVKIHDINYRGGQAYVYRLTLTADPYLDRLYPLGGRRGSQVAFEATGQGLPSGPVSLSLPGDGPAQYAVQLPVGSKLCNPIPIELDDLPEFMKTERNRDPSQVEPVPLPAVLNGRIDRPGAVDHWAFQARKGEVQELDLRAARLGSPLCGVVVVSDASDKELARAEFGATPQGDPQLRFTAPADGTYRVRIEERFRSRGSPAHAYRLRIAAPVPDFRLRLPADPRQPADALTVNRGGQAKMRITAERLGGFAEPITLAIDGLPPGVTAAPLTITAKQAFVDVTFKAADDAKIQAARLTIRGTASISGQTITRTAAFAPVWGMPELDSVLLALALPTPFKVVGEYDMRWAARGTIHQRHYRIERDGFEGPIEVSLADKQSRHLQGVTGPTIAVPPGVSEFDYAVQLPPWMETGRTSRTCVMAVGLIKDKDGSDHVVSFTSTHQNEQVIAVIEPGRLGIEVDHTSLTVTPGKTIPIAVRMLRGPGLQGPVKLELVVASHVHGVTADAVEIPADQERATLAIRFADGAGPFNAPLVLRATVMDRGKPVLAETRLPIHRGR
jgi:hypothetical protein